MGGEYVLFAIVEELILDSAIALGGLFVLLAWGKVIAERIANAHWRISKQMYAWTASVSMPVLGQSLEGHFANYLVSRDIMGVPLLVVYRLPFILGGFVLFLVGLGFACLDNEAGSRIVWVGSCALLFIFVFGVLGMVVAQP
jgi:hypothetical protein